MMSFVILITFSFFLLFGAYYTCIKKQEKLLETSHKTQNMLNYAPGIKDRRIDELHEELGKKCYQQAHLPNDKTLIQEIKVIEDQIDDLKNTPRYHFT
jgi:ABC-type nickel/cobalt efflux system permease component RcnA